MSTDTAERQPKGIPSGGQFAATSHAEPVVGLVPPAITSDQFSVLMTEELGTAIDARLKGRISGKDWYSGAKKAQVFETEPDGDGGLQVYTRTPASEDGATYTITVVEGQAQVGYADEYNTEVKPVQLHPARWDSTDAAAQEISDVILEMEGGATDAIAARNDTPDGFASNADYRRWKER